MEWIRGTPMLSIYRLLELFSRAKRHKRGIGRFWLSLKDPGLPN